MNKNDRQDLIKNYILDIGKIKVRKDKIICMVKQGKLEDYHCKYIKLLGFPLVTAKE